MMEMPTRKKYALGVVVAVLALVGGYWGLMWALGRNPMLNLTVVEPGKLLRSGEPRVGDVKMIKEKYGLGTIFCLSAFEDKGVKAWAEENGVKLISIKMQASVPPTDDQIGLFFDIMSGETIELIHYKPIINQNIGFIRKHPVKFPFPVLIHCIGGSDRTGVMTAIYRMAHQGWTLPQAKREMSLHRHITWVHPAQFDFLEKIAPALTPRYGSRQGQPRPPSAKREWETVPENEE